jgi:hypothetical protein
MRTIAWSVRFSRTSRAVAIGRESAIAVFGAEDFCRFHRLVSLTALAENGLH